MTCEHSLKTDKSCFLDDAPLECGAVWAGELTAPTECGLYRSKPAEKCSFCFGSGLVHGPDGEPMACPACIAGERAGD